MLELLNIVINLHIIKEDLMLLKIPRYNTGNGAKDRSDCIMERIFIMH